MLEKQFNKCYEKKKKIVCVCADLTQNEVAPRGGWLALLHVSGSHGYQSSALITHLNPLCPSPFLCCLLSPVPSSCAHFDPFDPVYSLPGSTQVSLNEFLTSPQPSTPHSHSTSLLWWQHFFWAVTFSTDDSAGNSLCGQDIWHTHTNIHTLHR